MLPLLIVLFSCQKSTNETYSLTNNSSDMIFVRILLSGEVEDTTFKMLPNQTPDLLIKNSPSIKKSSEKITAHFKQLETFTLAGNSGLRNLLDNKNWRVIIEKTSKNPIQYNHRYNCTITDVDFE
jgi:hypothetical protein